MKQTVAGGQYEFPKGLFYGGDAHAKTVGIVADHMHDWLGNPEEVIHLDFHTGLGRSTTYKLLAPTGDSPTKTRCVTWAKEQFGQDVVEDVSAKRTAYDVRGGFGTWCDHHAPHELFLLLPLR